MSKITILGIGADGINSLNKKGLQVLKQADIIFGSNRHLEMIDTNCETINWVSPFSDNIEIINKHFIQNKNILIVATGDVNWFGITNIIRKNFDNEKIQIITNISSISLSAIKMGWPLQDITPITIHGRDINSIITKIYDNAKLIILSHNKQSPIAVCEILQKLKFSDSEVSILNNLGRNDETIQKFQANSPQTANSDLNCIAVECKKNDNNNSLCAGLDDQDFINDGQLTKREVRAITISSLQPYPNAVLWDIGAGSGSISVEWCRLGGKSWAFETDKTRCENIKQNSINLGVKQKLQVHNCTINKYGSKLPIPDCIFIGGGLTNINTEELYEQLKFGGRMVINSISIQGQEVINKMHKKYGGDIIRINIERNTKIGNFDSLRPMISVIHYTLKKV
jgi:precorrin-6Y C5,15-methyltransferase (decarboxylating)